MAVQDILIFLVFITCLGTTIATSRCSLKENSLRDTIVCDLRSYYTSKNWEFPDTVTIPNDGGNCYAYFNARPGNSPGSFNLVTVSSIDRERLISGCKCSPVPDDRVSHEYVGFERSCYLEVEVWSGQQLRMVYVELVDVNDNVPQFSKTLFSTNIDENMPEGTRIDLPSAIDLDNGLNGDITYKLEGPDATFFTLDVTPTGDLPSSTSRVSLKTRKRFDREGDEKKGILSLTLIASDKGSPSLTASLAVSILIDDRNDNPPVFSQPTYTVSVLESLPSNGLVARVNATDRDPGSKVTISIPKSADEKFNEMFHVERDGRILLRRILDFDEHESAGRWVIPLIAVDSGEPQKTATATLTVNVQNVNDNKPVIVVSELPEKVPENHPPGFPIVRFRVGDKDSTSDADIDCSLVPPSPDFRLDRVKPYLAIFRLVSVSQFDREKQPSYQVQVRCTDKDMGSLGGQQVSQQVINVIIGDENDSGPRFAMKKMPTEIHEGKSPGIGLVKVTAVDADMGENAEVEYSIPEGYSNLVTVASRTGFVHTARTFDREQEDKIVFRVVAKDAKKLRESQLKGEPLSADFMDTVEVTVTILDINDNSPHFDADYTFRVKEEFSGFVGKVKANDSDLGANSIITYSLDKTLGDWTMFSVNEDGSIHTRPRQRLDRESRSSFTLYVVATDAGRPSRSATVQVHVILIDINDNAPIFLNPQTTHGGQINVTRDDPINHPVYYAKATDADDGENAKITFKLEKGSPYFSIEPDSGIIIVNDPNAVPYPQHLSIRAEDGGIPPKSSLAFLSVQWISSRKDATGAGWGLGGRDQELGLVDGNVGWSRGLFTSLGVGLIVLIVAILILLLTYFAWSLRAASRHNQAAEGTTKRHLNDMDRRRGTPRKEDNRTGLKLGQPFDRVIESSRVMCCVPLGLFNKRSSDAIRNDNRDDSVSLSDSRCRDNNGNEKNILNQHESYPVGLPEGVSMLYTHIEEDGSPSSLPPYEEFNPATGQWTDAEPSYERYCLYAAGSQRGITGCPPSNYESATLSPTQRRVLGKMGSGRYIVNPNQTFYVTNNNNTSGGKSFVTDDYVGAADSTSSEEVKHILHVGKSTDLNTCYVATSSNDSSAGYSYPTRFMVPADDPGRRLAIESQVSVDTSAVNSAAKMATPASTISSKTSKLFSTGSNPGTLGRTQLRHAGYVAGSPCYTSSFV